MDKIIIGIDQSYNNIGICILLNKKVFKVFNIDLKDINSPTIKRQMLATKLNIIISRCKAITSNITIIFERIRLTSKGFLSFNYIKMVGAMNCIIIDIAYNNNIKCYSVDTRCWKSQVVGSSKKVNNNKHIPKEKYLTIKWCIKNGYTKHIIKPITKRTKIYHIIIDNVKYQFDNDKADSIAIAYFGIVGDKHKLQLEQ